VKYNGQSRNSRRTLPGRPYCPGRKAWRRGFVLLFHLQDTTSSPDHVRKLAGMCLGFPKDPWKYKVTSERRREDSAQTGSSVDHLAGLTLGSSDDHANSTKYPVRKRRNCRWSDGYKPQDCCLWVAKQVSRNLPGKLAVAFFNDSIRTTQHSSLDMEGDVVGDDALSRVDAGWWRREKESASWKADTGPGRFVGFQKFGKLSLSELGYNEARSDTCKRITPPSHFLRPCVPSRMMPLL